MDHHSASVGFDDEPEEDVCRVCRVEAEEDNPMVHPCKCSGSVKFVHADCLKNWLATSQKRYCEICGHKYTFKKVYPEYVPAVIPLIVYVRQSLLSLLRGLQYFFRAWAVIFHWLVMLPCCNMLSLRTLTWITDNLIYSSPLSLPPNATEIDTVLNASSTTATAIESPTSTFNRWDDLTIGDLLVRPITTIWSVLFNTPPMTFAFVEKPLSSLSLPRLSAPSLPSRPNVTSISWAALDPFLSPEQVTLPGFIFRGQILTLALAGVIITVILLREWVIGHDWAQHEVPAQDKKEEAIDPDEWIVVGGRARRKGTAVSPSGRYGSWREYYRWRQSMRERHANKDGSEWTMRRTKTYPLREGEQGAADEDLGYLDLAEASPPGMDEDSPPSAVAHARQVRSTAGSSAPRLFDDWAAAPAGPGPSTLAARRLASPVVENGMKLGDFKSIPGIASGSGETARTPSRMPEGKAVMWSPPEMLEDDKGKGKDRDTIEGSLPTSEGATNEDIQATPGTVSEVDESRDSTERPVPDVPTQADEAGIDTDMWLPTSPPRLDRPALRPAIPPPIRLSPRDAQPLDAPMSSRTYPTYASSEESKSALLSAADAMYSANLNSLTAELDAIRRGIEDLPLNDDGMRDRRALRDLRERTVDVRGKLRDERARLAALRARFEDIPEPDGQPVDDSVAEDGARPRDEDRLFRRAYDLAEVTGGYHPPTPPRPAVDDEQALRGPDRFLLDPAVRQDEDEEHGDEDEWEDIDDRDEDRPDPVALGQVEEPREDAEEVAELARVAEALEVVDGEAEMEEAGWDREDWDGVLEVIGLIGPLQNLAQNITLAVIIMGAALSLLVGMPMVIGKVLLCTDIIHPLARLATMTFRGVKTITDPVVDIAWEILREVLLIPGLASIRALESIAARKLGLATTSLGSSYTSTSTVDAVVPASVKPSFSTMSAWLASLPYLGGLFAQLSSRSVITLVLDTLEMIGHTAYTLHARSREISLVIAKSGGLADRAWSLVLAYAVGLVLAGLIALLAEDTPAPRDRRGVADEIRKYWSCLKLGFFLGLELLAFPLCVGICIDLSIIPLFPGATLANRLQDLQSGPFGTLFVAWLTGTTFMYGFAQMLSWVRAICRPGAMFFIRDPHDPSYAPVKDIIERPARGQIRKLAISSVLYSMLIWWLFGAVTWGVSLQPWVKVLPLRLHEFGPISSTPFDYVLLLLVAPPMLNDIRFRHRIKKLLSLWWHSSSRVFNLTSVMFGVRMPPGHDKDETESLPIRLFWAALDVPFRVMFGPYFAGPTFARVPADDHVVLLPRTSGTGREGALVPLTAHGTPRTRADKIRIIRQDLATHRAKRDPKTDYVTVWLPRYWRTRVYVHILATAIAAGLAVGAAVFTPLLVGRGLMGMVLGKVHDGYSMITGFFTLYALAFFARKTKSFVSTLDRAAMLRKSSRSTRIKRSVFTGLRRVYALVMLFGVHAMFRGILWELQAGMVIRYGTSEAASVLHIWDAWAMGVVLDVLEIAVREQLGQRYRPPATFDRLHGFFRRPFRARLGPLTGAVLLSVGWMVCQMTMPLVLTLVMNVITAPLEPTDAFRTVQLRFSGPVTWLYVTLWTHRRWIKRKVVAWRQGVIDAEYVLEERVENYVAPSTQEREQGGHGVVLEQEQDEADEADEAEGEGEGEGEDLEVEEVGELNGMGALGGARDRVMGGLDGDGVHGVEALNRRGDLHELGQELVAGHDHDHDHEHHHGHHHGHSHGHGERRLEVGVIQQEEGTVEVIQFEGDEARDAEWEDEEDQTREASEVESSYGDREGEERRV